MVKKNCTLSDEQLKKMKREVRDSLANDRNIILNLYPFTGNISMRFDLIPVRDKRCRTACTDGKNIYMDIDFYSKLKTSERTFVLAHEIWHAVMLHLSRKQSRQAQLFNIAADMEVNYLLATSDSHHQLTAPDGLCFPPPRMAGKSAEVIYEWLLRKAKKNKLTAADISLGSEDMKGDSNNNYRNEQICKDKATVDKSREGKNGSKTGKLEGQFDKHTYQGEEDTESQEPVTDQWGEVGIDEDFKPSVPEDFAEKMREASISAAQTVERTQGTLPASITSILEKLRKPEIKWQELLAQFVTSIYSGKRQWIPPNRRHVYNDTYFQSRRNEAINIAVAIDTSGSCISELPKFFGELNGLVKSFGSYTLHLLECDAAVNKYEYYDDGNPLELEEADKIEWSGGGGTSFVPVFDYIEKEGIQIDALVYLTDSFGTAPKDPPNYPVLWLLTHDGDENFCEWGRKVKFKENNYDY